MKNGIFLIIVLLIFNIPPIYGQINEKKEYFTLTSSKSVQFGNLSNPGIVKIYQDNKSKPTYLKIKNFDGILGWTPDQINLFALCKKKNKHYIKIINTVNNKIYNKISLPGSFYEQIHFSPNGKALFLLQRIKKEEDNSYFQFSIFKLNNYQHYPLLESKAKISKTKWQLEGQKIAFQLDQSSKFLIIDFKSMEKQIIDTNMEDIIDFTFSRNMIYVFNQSLDNPKIKNIRKISLDKKVILQKQITTDFQFIHLSYPTSDNKIQLISSEFKSSLIIELEKGFEPLIVENQLEDSIRKKILNEKIEFSH